MDPNRTEGVAKQLTTPSVLFVYSSTKSTYSPSSLWNILRFLSRGERSSYNSSSTNDAPAEPLPWDCCDLCALPGPAEPLPPLAPLPCCACCLEAPCPPIAEKVRATCLTRIYKYITTPMMNTAIISATRNMDFSKSPNTVISIEGLF